MHGVVPKRAVTYAEARSRRVVVRLGGDPEDLPRCQPREDDREGWQEGENRSSFQEKVPVATGLSVAVINEVRVTTNSRQVF